MKILYKDQDIIVCIKPPRVLSTDEPGGLPDLLREALEDPSADIRTVHRLDRVVSGVMVLARNKKSASELSAQIREDHFQKQYFAVIHGVPDKDVGRLEDLLGRDKARKMTYVAQELGKGIQQAILDYETIGKTADMSMVKVNLITGRTHQIRVQFSSRGMPLVGERKYDTREDPCEIALWSQCVKFRHPTTGEWMVLAENPPCEYPWNLFL